MISPCINICKIDKQNQLCVGCKRTLDEIANWSKYTSTQRKEIIDILKYR